MKKYFLFVIAFGLLLLVGCHASKKSAELTKYEPVNNLDRVTMIIKEGTVTSTGLTVEFKNHSDRTYTYGEFFFLEKKVNDNWYEVPVAIKEDYGFNDIGYELAPLTVKEHHVDWNWLYGSLEAGEYRMIKDILEVREPGGYDEYDLAVEFIVE